ncbi:hypothetical protein YC2023_100030 [Brassica napus]
MTLRLYREDREEGEGLLDRVPSKRNILNDSEWSSGRNNGNQESRRRGNMQPEHGRQSKARLSYKRTFKVKGAIHSKQQYICFIGCSFSKVSQKYFLRITKSPAHKRIRFGSFAISLLHPAHFVGFLVTKTITKTIDSQHQKELYKLEDTCQLLKARIYDVDAKVASPGGSKPYFIYKDLSSNRSFI